MRTPQYIEELRKEARRLKSLSLDKDTPYEIALRLQRDSRYLMAKREFIIRLRDDLERRKNESIRNRR